MMKRLKYGVFGIVSLLLSIGFGYCDFVNYGNFKNYSVSPGTSNIEVSIGENDLFCMGKLSSSSSFSCFDNNNNEILYHSLACWSGSYNLVVSCTNNNSYNMSLETYYYTGLFSSSSCPEVNTGEILSGYILESEIDNLYCENHGYCPIIDTGDIEDQWSALYINDIQHIGAGLINLTIPEEIERDYEYTGNGEELDIDIKGYNVDTAYIDGLITTQRTLPNNTDFNNTISGLLPLFVPGIVIIFFLYFIFRFIKKVF